MGFYKKHIFVCVNQKPAGRKCCAMGNTEALSDYLRAELKRLDYYGPDKIRVSCSKCLGRCKLGPCMVVYPDEVWYSPTTEQDIDDIIQQHLLNGEQVSRLLIDA